MAVASPGLDHRPISSLLVGRRVGAGAVTFVAILFASLLFLSEASAQVDEGRAQLEAGNARAAMIRFEKAVRAQPDDPEARLGLAEALIRLGEFERAEKMAQVALRRTGDPNAAIVMAEALYGQEKFAVAEEVLKDAEGHPDYDVLSGILQGERALRVGQPEEALGHIRAAAAHDRLGIHARLIGARAQYARGDFVRAQRLINRISAENGKTVPALMLSAQLAIRSGDDDRAQELATELLELDPGNPSATAVLVETSLRAQNVGAARAALAQIAPRDPADPRPAFLEAMILLQEGEYRRAADVVSTIETWLGSAPGGAVLLGKVRMETGRMAQAERALRERVFNTPTDRAARRLLVKVYDQTDRPDRADAIIEDGLALNADDPILLALKADRLMARQEFDAAAEVFRRIGLARKVDLSLSLADGADTTVSGDVEGLGHLISGYALLRQSDPNGAMAAAQSAADAGVAAPIVATLMASAAEASGDVARAKQILDDTIEQTPNFLGAILSRAALENDPAALARFLEVAIDQGASTPLIVAKLAAEKYVLGETDEALSLAKTAWDTAEPQDVDGLIYHRLRVLTGDTDAAVVEATRAAAEMVPQRDGDAMRLIASILEDAGAVNEASDVLRRLARGGEDAFASAAAAAAFQKAGQDDDARELLALAHARHPKNQAVAAAYMEALARRDLELAFATIERRETLQFFNTIDVQARMYAAAGQTNRALEMLSDAPLTMPTVFAWAKLSETTAQKSALAARLGPMIDERPGDLPLMVLASAIALDIDADALARKAISSGLAAKPGDPILLNNLAQLNMSDDPTKALEQARRAHALLPQHPEVARTLTAAYRATGDLDAADAMVRRLALLGERGD